MYNVLQVYRISCDPIFITDVSCDPRSDDIASSGRRLYQYNKDDFSI